MPVKRFRGTHYRQLLSRLPRNLLVFDAHCLMCQARVRYVVERNFSFFSFANYAASDVDQEMSEGLDRHRIHFASLDSPEGTDIHRSFFQRLVTRNKSSGASAATPTTALPVLPIPEDLVIVFVEKVPSQTASFLARVRPGGLAADDRTLFQQTSPSSAASGTSSSSSASSSTSSARLVHSNETDLLVSTNYAAMCRVGMHLDRFLVRSAFRALYYAVPSSIGDAWFDRYVSRRRKKFWGTSEQDAVKEDGIIEGMRERRWTWRSAAARR